jgi:alpha-glucosidase
MGNLPALVQLGSGECILFLEANTWDYPVMWIKKSDTGLVSHYWGVPDGYRGGSDSWYSKRTTGNKDYIANTSASRDFPWKLFAVAEKETGLLTNQLVYLLGQDCKIENTSWIKPGWVILDWWARRGIYGVDFKAGINNETAKYMIDFSAEFGLQYFLFDYGWTAGNDLTKVIPEVDMAEIVRYANSKNVDVLLWVAYSLFDDQMEAALQQFRKWGVKGVKIDFMNRSDQEIVNFYWRAAEACAKYKMVVNFHGAYRPDGLRRAYPNVLTREALIEFEYSGINKDWDNPDHHCTLPFIRGVAGPMDYIPGTMNNASKKDFALNGDKLMGQGTRAHSMAMAVICESPMQMIPDAPPLYYRERECTEFLIQIPVEWDEIVPLDGKLGDFVALARRNGNTWYVAAITDWSPRTMEINFDFLDEGKLYQIEIIKDGINADVTAVDYKKEVGTVKKGDKIQINMASGGGWIAKIKTL